MSDSVQPHRQQPTRLPRPSDSPGKNTGVGCRVLLQCMRVKSESEVAQSCPTPSDPMDCSLPGSSIHGIFQARVLEWGAIAFSASMLYRWLKKKIQCKWIDTQWKVYFPSVHYCLPKTWCFLEGYNSLYSYFCLHVFLLVYLSAIIFLYFESIPWVSPSSSPILFHFFPLNINIKEVNYV